MDGLWTPVRLTHISLPTCLRHLLTLMFFTLIRHQHIMMPGAKSKFPRDCLKVNDEFIPVAGWLDELKKDWNIE